MRFSKVFMISASFCAILALASGHVEASSATGATQAKHAAQQAAVEKLDPGSGASASGRGTDLKAITSQNKAPTTFTGFPAGTLPGGNNNAAENGEPEQPKHIALVGQPLLGAVSELNIGQGLSKIGTIADQVGYTLVPRKDYKPTSPTEAPYSWYLMNGKKRVSTLFFDCQLKLCEVR